MTDAASDSPRPDAPIPGQDRAAALIVLMILGMVVLGLCVLLPVAVPALQSSRETARLAACQARLKDVALASTAWSEQPGLFHPPQLGQPPVSWRVGIAEPLDGVPVGAYDPAAAWDDPVNKPLTEQTPQPYLCPSSAREAGLANFVYATGPVTLWAADDAAERLQRIGLSYRLLAVERAHAEPYWTQPSDTPGDWQPRVDVLPIEGNPLLSSAHPAGAHGALFDGRVQVWNVDTDTEVIETLTSPTVPDVGEF